MLGEVSIEARFATRFALTNGFAIAYDATPPDGVKTYDLSLKTGVLVTF